MIYINGQSTVMELFCGNKNVSFIKMYLTYYVNFVIKCIYKIEAKHCKNLIKIVFTYVFEA